MNDQNPETSTNTDEKSPLQKYAPIVVILIAVAIIAKLLFGGGVPDTPEGVAEEYTRIYCKAINNGSVNDKELTWLTTAWLDPKFGNASAAEIQQAIAMKKELESTNRRLEIHVINVHPAVIRGVEAIVLIDTELKAGFNGEIRTDQQIIRINLVNSNGWKIVKVGNR